LYLVSFESSDGERLDGENPIVPSATIRTEIDYPQPAPIASIVAILLPSVQKNRMNGLRIFTVPLKPLTLSGEHFLMLSPAFRPESNFQAPPMPQRIDPFYTF
jgi:hypothetical protein